MPPPPLSQCPKLAYEYRCTDDSLLTKWISKHLAPRIEKILPSALSANFITVLGTALVMVSGLTVAALPRGSSFVWFGTSAALIWLYCLLDHVDGCRARARGTSGPVGEFLDHSLDAANIFIIAYLVLAAGRSGAPSPGIDSLLNAACAAVTIATWCEQHAVREIRLPALGPVEGLLCAVLFLFSLHVPAMHVFWSRPAFGPLTCFDVLLLVATAGMFATTFKIALSTPAARPAVLGVALTGILASALAHLFPSLAALVPLLLGCLTFGFAAGVISAHLNHLALPSPALLPLWAALLAAATTLLLVPPLWPWVFACAALFFSFRAFGLWGRAFLSLPSPRPLL